MATNISRSPNETAALGEAWGSAAQSGLVIALCGDLGAGKTQLVKGVARGLRIETRVHSPTFALVNIYEGGRLPLFHLDLYRLDNREQVVQAGLEEFFYPRGITVVEWAERWFGPNREEALRSGRPANAVLGATQSWITRWVELEITGENERRISYEDFSV